jgi:FixJ family two-component response regulator
MARALELLQGRGFEIPFIIISGAIGEEIAVAVVKMGAADYILKDRLARLGPAISQAMEQTRLRTERKRTEEELRTIYAQLQHLQ